MTISGAGRLAGIIGWPVTQSLSPRLHMAWIAEQGLDGAYVPFAVRPEDFGTVVEGLRLAGVKGLNVTVPHKEAAFALAERHDEAAAVIGAANLLLFTENGIEGRNTDSPGLAAALRQALGPMAVAGKPVAVWGAGGTARAAVHALAGMGAAEIRVFNRTRPRAEALAASLGPRIATRLAALGYEDWEGRGGDVALLVHTTSAGMKGAPSVALTLDVLPADAAVCDVVYNPLETEVLARAKARGLRTVDGLGMLMHQAVPSFAAFFGVEPKVTPALRELLVRALPHG